MVIIISQRKNIKELLIKYKEGNYESLVVTLGDGSGDNFWCVLFPPLCLLEAEDTNNEVEYKFFVKELIDKYLK